MFRRNGKGFIGFNLGFGDGGGGGAFLIGIVLSAKLDDLITLHLLSCSNLFEVESERTNICLHVFTALELRDSLDFFTEEEVGIELLSLELLRELVPLDFLSSEEELRSLMTSRMKDLTRARPFCFGVTLGLSRDEDFSKVLDLTKCFSFELLGDFRWALESATALRVLASASATTLWLGRGGTGGGPFTLVGFMGSWALLCTISMPLLGGNSLSGYYKEVGIVRSVFVVGASESDAGVPASARCGLAASRVTARAPPAAHRHTTCFIIAATVPAAATRTPNNELTCSPLFTMRVNATITMAAKVEAHAILHVVGGWNFLLFDVLVKFTSSLW